MNIYRNLKLAAAKTTLNRTARRVITAAVLVGGLVALPQVSLANAPIHEAGCVEWSADWGCTSWSDCVVYTSLRVWHCTYSTYGIITGQSSGSY